MGEFVCGGYHRTHNRHPSQQFCSNLHHPHNSRSYPLRAEGQNTSSTLSGSMGSKHGRSASSPSSFQRWVPCPWPPPPQLGLGCFSRQPLQPVALRGNLREKIKPNNPLTIPPQVKNPPVMMGVISHILTTKSVLQGQKTFFQWYGPCDADSSPQN